LNEKGGLDMKHKLVLNTFTMLILIGGCSSYKSGSSSNECIDCQRLRDILKYLKEKEHVEKVVLAEFNDRYEHSDGGEAPWEDVEKIIIQSTGCCVSSHHPLSKEWEEYEWLGCIWKYLEKENVQRIAFYEHVHSTTKPEDWGSSWAEITEPREINEALKLIHEAIEKAKDRFANEGIVIGHGDRMQIVTDKHKFIIPVGCGSREDEAIRGLGWTSCKLRIKLTDWGITDPVSEKEYRTLNCILGNIEEENVQRIVFYKYVPVTPANPSNEWHLWGEITGPRKINETLKLLRGALKKGKHRIDEERKDYYRMRMQIISDKRKYLMPIFLDKKAVYGAGWTSDELRRKLAGWGFPEPK
jgi:hypothetical protein